MITYCSYCGVQFDDSLQNCPNCGTPVQAQYGQPQQYYPAGQYNQQPPQYYQPVQPAQYQQPAPVIMQKQTKTPYQIAMKSLGSAIALPCIMFTLYAVALICFYSAYSSGSSFNAGTAFAIILFFLLYFVSFVFNCISFGVQISNLAKGIRGRAIPVIIISAIGLVAAIYMFISYAMTVFGAGILGENIYGFFRNL